MLQSLYKLGEKKRKIKRWWGGYGYEVGSVCVCLLVGYPLFNRLHELHIISIPARMGAKN